MEQRVAELEAEVKELKSYMVQLMTVVIPKVRERVKGHDEMFKEWRDGTGKFAGKTRAAGGSKSRKPLNYDDWLRVQGALNGGEGESFAAIARELELPQTTVRTYAKMEPAKVQELEAAKNVEQANGGDDDGAA